jgi:hypothetical protein
MAATKREFLEPWEREVVLFIERWHSMYGTLPDDNQVIDYLNSIDFELAFEKLVALKRDFLFQESMRVRGIFIDANERLKTGQLSPRQMQAAATMLNYVDGRSDAKKLRDLGITAEEWDSWMLNEGFANYVNGRAERMMNNLTHEAHKGLIKGMRQGNTKSIELFYELTGRYTKNQDSGINPRQFIGQILEIIQRHVKDPQTLNQMALEMSQLAIEASSPAQTTIKVGPTAITHRELEF